MERPEPKIASVGVPVLRWPLTPGSLAGVNCLECGTILEIHQPEGGYPERMLGTCEQCHHWYLWDFHPDANWAVMVRLPEHGYFLRGYEAGTAAHP